MAQRVIPSLPRIKVPIGHIPQRLKTAGFDNPRGRLEVLRRLVNDVFREERVEMKYNRAVECRQYVERLIQLGVYRGTNDPYTMEMMEWWFVERDLLDKMFNIIVPRFATAQEPFTSLYLLPRIRALCYAHKKARKWSSFDVGVLELNGNPFPSMQPLEEERQRALREYVKDELNERRLKN